MGHPEDTPVTSNQRNRTALLVLQELFNEAHRASNPEFAKQFDESLRRAADRLERSSVPNERIHNLFGWLLNHYSP